MAEAASVDGAGSRAKPRSDDEVQNWMQQRRQNCEVWSTSGPQVEEEEGSAASSGPKGKSASQPTSHKGDAAVQNWMLSRRSQCEVLESTPETTAADAFAKSIDEQRKERALTETEGIASSRARFAAASGGPVWPQQAKGMLRTAPRELQAWVAQIQGSKLAQEETSPTHSPTTRQQESEENAAIRERLYAGEPLDAASRQEVWTKLLLREAPITACLDSQDDEAAAPPGLISLLGQRPRSPTHRMESFAEISTTGLAAASGSGKDLTALAVAFSKQFFTWLPIRPSGKGAAVPTPLQDEHVYLVLIQLLRYHFPAAALNIEAAANAAEVDIVSAMTAASNQCSIGVNMSDIVFEVEEDADSNVLLFLCDLTILVDEDMLLLFVIVVMLGEYVPIEAHCSFEQLNAQLRSALTFQSISSQGFAEACQIVSQARALLRTTPWSLSSALSPGNVELAPPIYPICQLAPEEVLHHAYETPGNAQGWRLLVVDARMRAGAAREDGTEDARELPVCVPLQRNLSHAQRRKMLLEIPQEECIHLCIVGDSAPRPGDDAFELCSFMCGGLVKRTHMSVVRGGWPAIESLATTLGLSLLDRQRYEHEGAVGAVAALAAAEEAATHAVAAVAEASDRIKEQVRERAGWALQGLGGLLQWRPQQEAGMEKTDSTAGLE
mmetsp:Transcript_6101/g.10528  ORF Transcript_6101/g.10528 Transcript_6101/m.10528 type:complete len:668 (-) Transcript_6101:54-2057(-)